jgi:hypothetical protein
MRKPVDGNVTQGFHAAHLAVDIAGPHRAPVYAPHAGLITHAGQLGSGTNDAGLAVDIDSGTYKSRLGHNDQIIVSPGQSVAEGQHVAYQGYTGYTQPDNVVAGSHVHWVLWENGTRVDGRNYITGSAAPNPTIAPNQRVLENQAGVYQRAEPNTGSAIIKDWPYDLEPFTFRGFVRGQDPYGNGNNIWFVGAYSNGYFWSGAFVDKGTHDLPDLTLGAPAPAAAPTEVFAKELPVVTEVVAVHPSNYETGNFPEKPPGVVLHDFGTDGRDTLGSSLNHFKNVDTTAPHFVVSGNRIVQTGKLSWRMYHAGPKGNDKIGIEIDPDVDTNPETEASVRLLLKALDAYYGYPLTRHKHSEFMATSCGDDVDLAKFQPESIGPVTSVPVGDMDQENNRLLQEALLLLRNLSDKINSVFK